MESPPTTLRVIDLFAGIGGMSLGFVQASGATVAFRPVFAVEWEPRAAEIYRQNFGDHIHVGDIAEVAEFPAAEIVIGGPPCQGFSALGTRALDDPRNRLWRHFVRALEQVRPEVFVMENVPQLLGSGEFEHFRASVGELGYEVRAEVVNAADYGVPQRRRRAICIGSRVGRPPWPRRTHRPDEYLTFREAVEGLPLAPDGRAWHRDRPGIRPMSRERYRAVPEGGNRFDLARNRPDLLPECWRKKRTGTTDVFGRLWWDRPALTIRTEFYKPEKGRYLHPTEHRPITVREAACLQSFPPYQAEPPTGFILPEDLPMGAVARGIGNAVPPALARAIARAIARDLVEAKRDGLLFRALPPALVPAD